MRVMKMLGLAAVAAMALMALAGASSASATILTCTESNNVIVQCPHGEVIDASVEGGTIKLTGTKTITCPSGTVKGSIEIAGSSTETVSAKTSEVTFPTAECTPSCTTIDVTNGTLEVHTENNGTTANGNGTLTGSGFTATITCEGLTCKYKTGNGLHMGTVTGSSNLAGSTATIDIDATLVREEGFLCTATATWEGSYKITSPDWLDVD